MNRRPKQYKFLSRGDLHKLSFTLSYRGCSANVFWDDDHDEEVWFSVGNIPGCYFAVKVTKWITRRRIKEMAMQALIRFVTNKQRIKHSAALCPCYRFAVQYDTRSIQSVLSREAGPEWRRALLGFRICRRSEWHT